MPDINRLIPYLDVNVSTSFRPSRTVPLAEAVTTFARASQWWLPVLPLAKWPAAPGSSFYGSFLKNTLVEAFEVAGEWVPGLTYIREAKCITHSLMYDFQDTTLKAGPTYGTTTDSRVGSGGAYQWEADTGQESAWAEVTPPSYPFKLSTGERCKQIKLVAPTPNTTYTLSSAFDVSVKPYTDQAFSFHLRIYSMLCGQNPNVPSGVAIRIGTGEFMLDFREGQPPRLLRMKSGWNSHVVVSTAPESMFQRVGSGAEFSFVVRAIRLSDPNSFGSTSAEASQTMIVISPTPDLSSSVIQPQESWIYVDSPPTKADPVQLEFSTPESDDPSFVVAASGCKFQFAYHPVIPVGNTVRMLSPILGTSRKTTLTNPDSPDGTVAGLLNGVDAGGRPRLKLSALVSNYYDTAPPYGLPTYKDSAGEPITDHTVANIVCEAVDVTPPENSERGHQSVHSYRLLTTFYFDIDRRQGAFFYRVDGWIPALYTPLPEGAPPITAADVVSASVSMTQEGATGNITLWNYPEGSTIDEPAGPNGGRFKQLCNSLRWQIDMGYYTDRSSDGKMLNPKFLRVFEGRSLDYRYSRGTANRSTVSINLVDRAWDLKAIRPPFLEIFDGWCILEAIRFLAREYGMLTEDQILVYQNPRDPDLKLTLQEYEDQAIASGQNCKEGQCDHALPGGGWAENPLYMFQEFSPLWEALDQLHNWKYSWLFVNNYGNLIFAPKDIIANLWRSTAHYVGSVMLEPGGRGYFEFQEAMHPNAYNELTAVSANKSVEAVVNDYSVWGLSWKFWSHGPIRARAVDEPSIMGIAAEKVTSWDQITNYLGIPRRAFVRKPELDTQWAVRSEATIDSRRAARPKLVLSWECAAGQPDIFVFDTILVKEEGDHIGIGAAGKKFHVTKVTHSLDANNKTFTTNIEADYMDPAFSVGSLPDAIDPRFGHTPLY